MRSHNLRRVSVHDGECSPQNFVTANDLVKAFFKSLSFKTPHQPHSDGDVVNRAAGRQLVEEPQSLLGE